MPIKGRVAGQPWPFIAVASVIFLVCALVPIVAAAGALAGAPAPESEHRLTDVMLTTYVDAIIVGAAAALLGWAPGRLLGRARRRGILFVFTLLPVCLPAYAVFYAWWQAWPAGTPLFEWIGTRGWVPAARHVTLLIALTVWSWPIPALFVAAAARREPRGGGDLLAVDGAPRLVRLRGALRDDAGGLVAGGVLVGLLTAGNTTSFDLAQVYSFGNELRALAALGAAPGTVVRAAIPAIIVAAVGAFIAWRLLAPRPLRRGAIHAPRPGVAISGVTVIAIIAGLAPPVVLTLRAAADPGEIGTFIRLYGESVGLTLLRAVISGVLIALLTGALAGCWLAGSRLARGIVTVQSIAWVGLALVPGFVVAAGLEAAWNRDDLPFGSGEDGLHVPLADLMYLSPLILHLGHIARFGFVAALLGRFAAALEPADTRAARELDGGTTTRGLLGAARPAIVAPMVAAGVVGAVLAFSEIAVTAAVHPPGSDPLAVRLLNDMHYQRPQSVMVATAIMVALAIGAALVLAIIARRRALLISAALVAGGCGGMEDGGPLDPVVVFGTPGLAHGQFSYPRCIAVDGERDWIYVIDKTARVQRFDFEGKPLSQWRMPQWENGKPTGISVAPDGRIFVADTHYHRIMAFDPEGNELLRFGSYGEGPGEFIYPTDIAFGPDGTLYIAEYGGNDRVQVFDDEGNYQFEFGSFGDGEQDFDRPQAIAFNPDRTELYIADSCNHRIVVMDPRGAWLRAIGTPGTEPGQLHYPYGFAFLEDGALLICEFGNNRLQVLEADGASGGRFGRMGAGEGELQYPWSLAMADEKVFVLDSGNNRIQVIRTP